MSHRALKLANRESDGRRVTYFSASEHFESSSLDGLIDGSRTDVLGRRRASIQSPNAPSLSSFCNLDGKRVDHDSSLPLPSLEFTRAVSLSSFKTLMTRESIMILH
eukprot:scaffold2220_cov75-Cylindrotheca_fusiformis.AAC.2